MVYIVETTFGCFVTVLGPPSLRAVASSLGPPSLRAVASPAELGPHNARFYYGIVLENGSNVRGVCQHVTNLS